MRFVIINIKGFDWWKYKNTSSIDCDVLEIIDTGVHRLSIFDLNKFISRSRSYPSLKYALLNNIDYNCLMNVGVTILGQSRTELDISTILVDLEHEHSRYIKALVESIIRDNKINKIICT